MTDKEKLYQERLALARIVYKEVKAVIDKWELNMFPRISCHWDECITIEEDLFQRTELKD